MKMVFQTFNQMIKCDVIQNGGNISNGGHEKLNWHNA